MFGDALQQRRSGLGHLRVHLAAGTHRQREQLRRVAATSGNIEHLHSGFDLRERQELRRMTLGIHAPVLIGADRICDHTLIAHRLGLRTGCRRRRATGHQRHQHEQSGRPHGHSARTRDHHSLLLKTSAQLSRTARPLIATVCYTLGRIIGVGDDFPQTRRQCRGIAQSYTIRRAAALNHWRFRLSIQTVMAVASFPACARRKSLTVISHVSIGALRVSYMAAKGIVAICAAARR